MSYLTRPVTDNRVQRAIGGDTLPSTLMDTLAASFGADTMTGLIGRQFQANIADSAADMPAATGVGRSGRVAPEAPKRLSPDELNARFPDMAFDAPMTEEAAGIIAKGRKAQMIRDDVLARGPGGFSLLPQFGASLLASALDPLEVATAFIPVVGSARQAAMIARFGAVRGRAMVGIAEGAIGNALTEPLYYGLSQQQQLDYGMADALLNIGIGGVLGGGLGAGAGMARRRAQMRADAEQTAGVARMDGILAGENAAEDALIDALFVRNFDAAKLRVAVTQMAEGRPVNVAEARIIEAQSVKRPQSIIEAVSQIGMRDDGGDLRASGIDRWHEGAPFRRRVVREDGAAPEDVAFRLYEDGWFDGTNVGAEMDAAMRGERPAPDLVRPMMDRLDAESRGAMQFRAADMDQAAAFDLRGEAAEDAMFRQRVRDDLVASGNGGLPAETTDGVAAVMRRDGEADVDVALERYFMEQDYLEGMRAASDPAQDPLADMAASRETDELLARARDVFEDDEAAFMSMLDEHRRAGTLIGEADAMLADMVVVDGKAAAARDVAQAYAMCLAR